MESSKTPNKIIDLGNQLVAKLSNAEQADTLSRWIAHYIAEQLAQVEQTTGPDQSAARERCFQSILTLWSHRATLPSGLRPLEEFEPILDLLVRLDPANPRPMWNPLGQRPDEEGELSETTRIIGFIFYLDEIAREFTDMSLRDAVSRAVKPETSLYLSEAIPTDTPHSLPAVRELVRRFRDSEAETDDTAESLARHQQLLDKLGKFCTLCQQVQTSMQTELDTVRAEVGVPK